MNGRTNNEINDHRIIPKGKLTNKVLSLIISGFIVFTIFPGSVLAASGDDDNAGLGWILFYITLIILIVIIILWIISYILQRGVIKRLEAQTGKISRYKSREEYDKSRLDREEDRDMQRRRRTPKGNCLVCNRKFIPGADAYQCQCGKFMHVHCIQNMTLCPYCGREIEKEVGIVRVEGTAKGVGDSDTAFRKKVDRLLKPKFCPVCNKIIKAGDSGMQCDCGAVLHIKCSDKTRKCPKCGQ